MGSGVYIVNERNESYLDKKEGSGVYIPKNTKKFLQKKEKEEKEVKQIKKAFKQ
ncbi:unnamed protein product, partial [marine sediment metagenome]